MFSILAYTKLDESPVKLNRANMGGGIPAPPPTYIPPEGASFNTWPNIYTNLKNIDYCTDQFDEITNRVKCIDAFISGPFLK